MHILLVFLFALALGAGGPPPPGGGEPDRRHIRFRPGHAMAAMGGEQDEIAFAELPVLSLALDAEPRSALNDQDPPVVPLIVPWPSRRRLSGRDDPVAAESRPLDERFHPPPGARRRRQIPSKVP